MKRMPFILLGAFLLLVLGCTKAPETALPTTKTLVVMAYDRSASTGDYYTLTPVQLDTLYNRVERHGGGEFIALHIQSNSALQVPISAPIGNLTLTPVAGLNVHQEKIRAKNERSQEQARLTRNRFQQAVYQKLLVPQNESSTDIDGVLRMIQLALNEPRFAKTRRIVILVTDGQQDLKGQSGLPVKAIELNAAEIHLVRPQNEALQRALGTKCPVQIHTSIDEAILSL